MGRGFEVGQRVLSDRQEGVQVPDLDLAVGRDGPDHGLTGLGPRAVIQSTVRPLEGAEALDRVTDVLHKVIQNMQSPGSWIQEFKKGKNASAGEQDDDCDWDGGEDRVQGIFRGDGVRVEDHDEFTPDFWRTRFFMGWNGISKARNDMRQKEGWTRDRGLGLHA